VRSIPRNKKDLLDLIQARRNVPAPVIVTIKPPEGTKCDPVNYLAKKFDPGTAGINIKSASVTKDQKALIRLSSDKDKEILRCPIFGTSGTILDSQNLDVYIVVFFGSCGTTKK
jgi:hypothetical protein